MKKQGFTLIELIAVIVILAIIGLIAIPLITGIVDKSKKGAAEVSALNYIDAVEKYNMLHDVNPTKYPYNIKDNTFNVSSNTEISLLDIIIPKAKAEGNIPSLNSFITVKGDKPKSGTVTIDKKGKVTEAELMFGKYDVECTGDKCIATKDRVTLTINEREHDVLEDGQSITLTVTTNSDKEITWSSSDESVASVTDGVVTGLKPGNVTITATIGSVKDSIDLTIIGGPTLVSANAGETHKGIVYLNPTNFSDACDASNSLSTFGRKEGCMKWYVISDSGSTYKMLLDHNILKGTRLYYNRDNNCSECATILLKSNTSGWQSTPRLISLDEINALTGISKITTYYFGPTPLVSSRNYSSQTDTEKARQRSFHWLFDNLEDCTSYGCSVEDNSAGVAYWTSTTKTGNVESAYFVHNKGSINAGESHATTWGGVRPVIEVDKNIFN